MEREIVSSYYQPSQIITVNLLRYDQTLVCWLLFLEHPVEPSRSGSPSSVPPFS